MKKFFLTILSGMLISLSMLGTGSVATADSPGEILIIVNKSANISSATTAEIKRVFTKQISEINGVKVVPIHAKKDSDLRRAFLDKVLGMTSAEENSFWEKQKISSGIMAPTELGDTLRGVFSLNGGISYCFRKDFKLGTAKILLVL